MWYQYCYPFGMMMPGREYQAQPSRFGFNGKENNNDVKGFGNQEDYGMRVYDTRLGKFLSVDPLQTQYPALTPYQFSGNTPIQAVDLDGRETYHYLLIFHRDGSKPTLQYQGVQTREFSWFESFYDKQSPATRFMNADGDLITTFKIKVWMPWDDQIGIPFERGTVGKLTPTIEFSSSSEFWGWVHKGLPSRPVEKPVDLKTQEQIETATTLLINEMYYNYEMQDGSFDFDSPPDISRLFSKGKNSPNEKINEQTTAANNGNSNSARNNSANNTSVPAPTEAYNRLKHYGPTPTQADRKALGATPTQDVDHTVPLVKHYYEGDGFGGIPGYIMTPDQRRAFASDRSKMKAETRTQNRSEGGKLSQYSKDMKKRYNLQIRKKADR